MSISLILLHYGITLSISFPMLRVLYQSKIQFPFYGGNKEPKHFSAKQSSHLVKLGEASQRALAQRGTSETKKNVSLYKNFPSRLARTRRDSKIPHLTRTVTHLTNLTEDIFSGQHEGSLSELLPRLARMIEQNQ